MNDKIAQLRAMLRQLLPQACALCGGTGDGAVCAGCVAQVLGAAPVRCPRCANPHPGSGLTFGHEPGTRPPSAPGSGLTSGHEPGTRLCSTQGTGPPRGDAPTTGLCGACLANMPAFDCTVVAADYALPVDQLVLQLKFGHRLALAPFCAGLLYQAVRRDAGFVRPALLCPVPLGPQRLRTRGYNQALEIARPLARLLAVPLAPRLLARVRDTAAQSSVAPAQRGQNIAGAFAVRDAALVAGRHIGIVDDVMTSGSTLNELAAMLKRHGATRVSNLVFARTPPH